MNTNEEEKRENETHPVGLETKINAFSVQVNAIQTFFYGFYSLNNFGFFLQ